MCLVIKCRKIVGGLGFGQCLVTRHAPTAVICTSLIDIITASACAISEIPAVDMKGQRFESKSIIRQGTQVLVDADSCRIEIIKKH